METGSPAPSGAPVLLAPELDAAPQRPVLPVRRARLPAGFGRIAAVSASLVGTTAVTSVLGLVYWTLAARTTSVVAVGVAGAAVSLMMLLGNVGMLGLGTLLIAEIPRTSPATRRRLVRTSLLVSGLASGVLGLLAALAVRVLPVGGLATLGSPVNALDFAVGTSLMGLTMVLDQAVLSVGSGRLQLERNVVSSVAKIVFLVALTAAGRRSGMDVFLAWTLGNLVSLPLVSHRTRGGRTTQERGPLVALDALRGLARSAAGHHVLNLVLQAPLQLLSLVVVVVLSATSNGYFSTARSVSGFVFVLPFSITIGLFAAAGGDEREVVRRMRLTVPLCLAASAAAVLALFPLGGLVLSVFGSQYSVSGLSTLRVLVLAGLPFVIKDHFVALRRVQGRTGQAAVAAAAGAVLEVAAAVVGARVDGLVGLCAFWVGALAVEAVLLAVPLTAAVRAVRLADAGVLPAPPRRDLPPARDAGRPVEDVPAGPSSGRIAVSGFGPVLALASCGLLLVAWAVTRSRTGAPGALTDCAYWGGYLLILLPAARRVLSTRTPRAECLVLGMAVPVLLQVSRSVLYPTRFMFHDELIHANGLRLIDATAHLFAGNSLLPVTEYYPGLEIASQGVQQLTHLPPHAAAAVVLLLARLVLAGCVITLVERLTGSYRAAALAGLVYSCNPQALFFNSQFSYQSLALPLALLTVHLFCARRPDTRPWQRLALPLLAMAATVLSHHLTSVLLVGALAAWLALDLVLRRGRPSGDRTDLQLMVLAGVVLVGGWALLPGNTLLSYLSAIVRSSVTDLVDLARGQESRTLFRNSSGTSNPLWEQVVSVSALLLVVVALVPALLHARTWWRRGAALSVLLGLAALAYPVVPAGHVTVTTAEVTDRSAGFLFLGVGFVLAFWLVDRRVLRSRRRTASALAGLSVLFVGGVIFGAGTTASQLPGRFLVSADSRSIDTQNLAAARWLREHVPEGTHVFADRVSGLLAAADGGQHTVTHIGDGIDASRLLLAPTFDDRDRQLITAARIDYVVVDERDATGLPNETVYVESGEYGEKDRRAPVPLTALRKLLAVPGVGRVYDNGSLVIYDVRALRGH